MIHHKKDSLGSLFWLQDLQDSATRLPTIAYEHNIKAQIFLCAKINFHNKYVTQKIKDKGAYFIEENLCIGHEHPYAESGSFVWICG